MKNRSSEGILFPHQINRQPETKEETVLPKLMTVPRKSWNLIENELLSAFSRISNCRPSNIFIFSHLRNGKIGFDDKFCIYTDSDCDISDDLLVKNDDVCSEEFGAEILIPILEQYYPDSKINQFLTPEKNENNSVFLYKLWKKYPSSLFIISRNGTEEPLWPENLPD